MDNFPNRQEEFLEAVEDHRTNPKELASPRPPDGQRRGPLPEQIEQDKGKEDARSHNQNEPTQEAGRVPACLTVEDVYFQGYFFHLSFSFQASLQKQAGKLTMEEVRLHRLVILINRSL
jgi:hypothetical protein